MHQQQFRLLMIMIRQMSLFFLQLSRKTDSRQVLYLIKILLYSLISVLTALVRSQEHSAMMISRDLKEKQDHRLLSYASQITMIPFRINRLHSTRFSFTIHLVSILQHTI